MRAIRLLVALLAVALFAAPFAHARTVVDFEIPEAVYATPAAQHLVLTGTSVIERSYLPFYIVALYHDREALPARDPSDGMQPVRVAITWLAPTLDAKAMSAYWRDAFKAASTDAAQVTRLAPFVDRLAKTIGPVKRGDLVTFDYNPDSGLHVARDGRILAQIPGLEFNRLFLSIWLGPSADRDVRRALLAPPEAAVSR